MSKAPKQIWVWWDDEYDVGVVSKHGDKRYIPDEAREYVRADRIEELEAKLTKAVEALDRIQDGSYGKLAAKARTILAELKGEDQ
jgi:predicted DNA-binding protein